MKRQSSVTFDPSNQKHKWDTAGEDVTLDLSAYKPGFRLHRGLEIRTYLMLNSKVARCRAAALTGGFPWADWQRGQGWWSCPGSWPLVLVRSGASLSCPQSLYKLSGTKHTAIWMISYQCSWTSILYSTYMLLSQIFLKLKTSHTTLLQNSMLFVFSCLAFIRVMPEAVYGFLIYSPLISHVTNKCQVYKTMLLLSFS